MMKKMMLYSGIVLLLINLTYAASSWTDDDPANSLWDNPLNWDQSGDAPPASSSSTFIRISDMLDPGDQGPIIDEQTAALCRRLSLEVNESGETLVLTMTGGTLDIYYAGVNNCYFRLGAGPGPGKAIANISGGVVNVDVDPDRYSPGANGYVRVGSGYTGQLNLSADTVLSAWDLIIIDSPDTYVDMRDNATMILEGDDTADIQGYIDAGLLRANGGDGMIGYDYDQTNPGKTTIVAYNEDLNPSPPNGAVIPTGTVELSWTNFEPNIPGDPVYVDVWFGSEPNDGGSTFTKVVDAGEGTTSVNVSAPTPGTYYWRVDSYLEGNTDPETIVEGPLFTFEAVNDLPPTLEDIGPDMVTWVNEAVQLNAVVTDDGASALTYSWEADDPCAVFSDPAIANPTVTTDNIGSFAVTVTVQDVNNPPVSDGKTINVYADACEAAREGANLDETYIVDINGDCIIDLEDFAATLSLGWLVDYTLADPVPVP